MKKIMLGAFLLAGISLSASANLIVNGDFDDGLNGWITNDVTIFNESDPNLGNVARLNDHDVDFFDSFGTDANNTAKLTQKFTLDSTINQVLVEFDYFFFEDDLSTKKSDSFYSNLFSLESIGPNDWDRTRLLTVKQSTAGDFLHFEGIFDVSGIFDKNNNAKISFVLNENPNNDLTDSSAAVDNISVTAYVPEPSTLSLMGLSLFGLGLIRRRKKV